MTERIVRSRAALEQAARSLCELPAEYLPLTLRVRKYRPRRSDEQNRRLWAIHHQVAAALCLMGKPKWTADDVHQFVFKPQFCGVAETSAGDVIVKRPRSSTELDKLEMAEAQARYEAWCFERGIELDLHEPEGSAW